MLNFLKLTLIVIIIFSCSSKTNENQNITLSGTAKTVKTGKISKESISLLKYRDFTLDVKTKPFVEPWAKYNELMITIDLLKEGDFSFFKDNTDFVTFINNFKSSCPKTLTSPAVSSRLLVLQTKLQRLENLLQLNTTTKTEKLESIKEIFSSRSNLNFQLNKKIEKDNQPQNMPRLIDPNIKKQPKPPKKPKGIV